MARLKNASKLATLAAVAMAASASAPAAALPLVGEQANDIGEAVAGAIVDAQPTAGDIAAAVINTAADMLLTPLGAALVHAAVELIEPEVPRQATLEECNAAILRFQSPHNYGTEADQAEADRVKKEADAAAKQLKLDSLEAEKRLQAEANRHALLLLGAVPEGAQMHQLSDESDEAFAERMGIADTDASYAGDIGRLG